jgi:hypothetical protein
MCKLLPDQTNGKGQFGTGISVRKEFGPNNMTATSALCFRETYTPRQTLSEKQKQTTSGSQSSRFFF